MKNINQSISVTAGQYPSDKKTKERKTAKQ
jgi:hypothetical protein